MANGQAPVRLPAQEAANDPAPVDPPHPDNSERVPLEQLAAAAAAADDPDDLFDSDHPSDFYDDFPETREHLVENSSRRIFRQCLANDAFYPLLEADEWYDFEYWEAFKFSNSMKDEVWDRVQEAMQREAEPPTVPVELPTTPPREPEPKNFKRGRARMELRSQSPAPKTAPDEPSSSRQKKRRSTVQDYTETSRSMMESRRKAQNSRRKAPTSGMESHKSRRKAPEASTSRAKSHASADKMKSVVKNKPRAKATSSSSANKAAASRSRSKGKAPLWKRKESFSQFSLFQ